MRRLRLFPALLAIVLIGAACSSSSPGASSGGDQSQAAQESQGGGASQPAASHGGGSGGGANGSITYQITGGYEASGERPFLPQASQWVDTANGWVANFANASGEGAYILLNTQTGQTLGQILTFGDGTELVAATTDGGYDCVFNLTKNDTSGLKGDMHCTGIPGTNITTGANVTVNITANWDAHP